MEFDMNMAQALLMLGETTLKLRLAEDALEAKDEEIVGLQIQIADLQGILAQKEGNDGTGSGS